MTCVSSPNEERGIVLLVLLWTLVLLSLLALNLASSVQTETIMARSTLDSEQAYFFARGALEEAQLRLTFPNSDEEKQKARFPYRGGMNHYWVQEGIFYSHVAILDEAGKLDLNFCEPKVLQQLLQVLGNDETISTNISEAVAEWRKPSTVAPGMMDSESSALGPDVQYVKHGPFDSVEELLLVPGVTREILYGSSIQEGSVQEEKGDTPPKIKGLVNYVTVFVGKDQINPNYAEPEVLAALPGLDMEQAQAIVSAREEEAFKTTTEIGERTALLLQGEAQSKLTTQLSNVYLLVATAVEKKSRVRRSVRAVFVKSTENQLERLLWEDEYWAPKSLDNWLNPGEATISSN